MLHRFLDVRYSTATRVVMSEVCAPRYLAGLVFTHG